MGPNSFAVTEFSQKEARRQRQEARALACAKIPDPGPVLQDLLHSSTCLHLGVKGFLFIPKLYKSTHICCTIKKKTGLKEKRWFESQEGADEGVHGQVDAGELEKVLHQNGAWKRRRKPKGTLKIKQETLGSSNGGEG